MRLAVLGSPIGHSLSPLLHRTAYDLLDLPWNYDAIDVPAGSLGEFLSACGPEWRGLSLTMPLKYEIRSYLSSLDRAAGVTGATNTVLFAQGTPTSGVKEAGGRRLCGFNTDVTGLVRAIRRQHTGNYGIVHILGSGATAASAVAACCELGFATIMIRARNEEAMAHLVTIGRSLGCAVVSSRLDMLTGERRAHRVSGSALGGEHDEAVTHPDVVISTLPATADVDVLYSADAMRQAFLMDVVYDPWPTRLGQEWMQAGGIASSGLPMLIYQALMQMRIFVGEDPKQPLPGESTIEAALFDVVKDHLSSS